MFVSRDSDNRDRSSWRLTIDNSLGPYRFTVVYPSADFASTGFVDAEAVDILPKTDRVRRAIVELMEALKEEESR